MQLQNAAIEFSTFTKLLEDLHMEAIKTAKEIEQRGVKSLIQETLDDAIKAVPVIVNEINPLWCDIFDKVEQEVEMRREQETKDMIEVRSAKNGRKNCIVISPSIIYTKHNLFTGRR
jgi:hypothetical protein